MFFFEELIMSDHVWLDLGGDLALKSLFHQESRSLQQGKRPFFHILIINYSFSIFQNYRVLYSLFK